MSDYQAMAAAGVVATPAVSVDGVIKIVGPDPEGRGSAGLARGGARVIDHLASPFSPKEGTVSEPTIGIVGGGRVARILLAGWKRANRSLSDVVVSDADVVSLNRLQAEFSSVTVTQDNRQAAQQRIVLFALHPPAFPSVLAEIKESLGPDAILVSLAPKWTMTRICGALGGFNRLARVIPNAPSIVNKGYNPLSFARQLTPADRARVLGLFAPLGACPEVPEDTLEAYAIVAAMGPTYLWYQLYQLIDLGCDFGLTRPAATEAVAAMVDGATTTMIGAGLTPEDVMDLIPVKPMASIEPTVGRRTARCSRPCTRSSRRRDKTDSGLRRCQFRTLAPCRRPLVPRIVHARFGSEGRPAARAADLLPGVGSRLFTDCSLTAEPSRLQRASGGRHRGHSRLVGHLGQQTLQHLRLGRLHQVVVEAGSTGFVAIFCLCPASQSHESGIRCCRLSAQFPRHVNPAHPRKVEVEKHDIRPARQGRRQRASAVQRFPRDVTEARHHRRQHLDQIGVIVHDEHVESPTGRWCGARRLHGFLGPASCATGRRTTNSAP